jgi:hypothetical protein
MKEIVKCVWSSLIEGRRPLIIVRKRKRLAHKIDILAKTKEQKKKKRRNKSPFVHAQTGNRLEGAPPLRPTPSPHHGPTPLKATQLNATARPEPGHEDRSHGSTLVGGGAGYLGAGAAAEAAPAGLDGEGGVRHLDEVDLVLGPPHPAVHAVEDVVARVVEGGVPSDADLPEDRDAAVSASQDLLRHEAAVVPVGELALEAEELAQLPLDASRPVAEEQRTEVGSKDKEAKGAGVEARPEVVRRPLLGPGIHQVAQHEDAHVGRPADQAHDDDEGADAGRPGLLPVLEQRAVADPVAQVFYVTLAVLHAGEPLQEDGGPLSGWRDRHYGWLGQVRLRAATPRLQVEVHAEGSDARRPQCLARPRLRIRPALRRPEHLLLEPLSPSPIRDPGLAPRHVLLLLLVLPVLLLVLLLVARVLELVVLVLVGVLTTAAQYHALVVGLRGGGAHYRNCGLGAFFGIVLPGLGLGVRASPRLPAAAADGEDDGLAVLGWHRATRVLALDRGPAARLDALVDRREGGYLGHAARVLEAPEDGRCRGAARRPYVLLVEAGRGEDGPGAGAPRPLGVVPRRPVDAEVDPDDGEEGGEVAEEGVAQGVDPAVGGARALQPDLPEDLKVGALGRVALEDEALLDAELSGGLLLLRVLVLPLGRPGPAEPPETPRPRVQAGHGPEAQGHQPGGQDQQSAAQLVDARPVAQGIDDREVLVHADEQDREDRGGGDEGRGALRRPAEAHRTAPTLHY